MANKTNFETINIDDFIHDPINQERVQSYPPELVGRFNSFIVTAFDDSMTVEMQLRTLIKWIKENIDVTMSALDNMEAFKQDSMAFQNHVKDTLVTLINQFTDKFDDNLQFEMQEILKQWDDEGYLQSLINEYTNERIDVVETEISNARGGKATLGQRLDETAAQLAQTVNQTINLRNPPKPLNAPKGDGVVDDTVAIQTIIDYCVANKKDLYVPNGTYMIQSNSNGKSAPFPTRNGTGLFIEGSLTMRSSQNAVFKTIPSSSTNPCLLIIRNTENVVIDGGNFLGERFEHLGTTGEGGHGISIASSKKIVVKNVNIRETWGDGIIVSGVPAFNGLSWCEDIYIDNTHIDQCSRNALTIGGIKRMYVNKSTFSNTNRTMPMAGVDLEPDASQPMAETVYFTNCVIGKNGVQGIVFGGGNGSKDISITNCYFFDNKEMDINIGGTISKPSKNVNIQGNTFKSVRTYGVFLTVVDGINITNNNFIGISRNTSIAGVSMLSVNDVKISHNSFSEFLRAVEKTGETIATASSIDSNYFTACKRSIQTTLVTNFKISNNIHLNNSDVHLTLTANESIIENNVLGDSDFIPMVVTLDKCIIRGNRFKNWGKAASDSAPAILAKKLDDSLIEANYFDDTKATHITIREDTLATKPSVVTNNFARYRAGMGSGFQTNTIIGTNFTL